jgi:hypothetical protein
MKRDHVIFVFAMAILCAGLTDGLHRGFGLSWFAAAPIGATVWGGLAYRIYLQSQKELAQEEETTPETPAA